MAFQPILLRPSPSLGERKSRSGLRPGSTASNTAEPGTEVVSSSVLLALSSIATPVALVSSTLAAGSAVRAIGARTGRSSGAGSADCLLERRGDDLWRVS